MELFYYAVFGACAALSAVLELGSRFGKAGNEAGYSPAFLSFRNNYLIVFSAMMAGDWLQGPYVYALYRHYGFERGAIGQLFIAGFGSSMVFGTIVGSMADKYGRKKAALLYCITYSIGCMTKHYNNYNVLFVGRVFCGVATSLLYSAFESWVVGEHFKRNFNPDWLGNLFSNSVFLGNGLMAIVSGLLAQTLAQQLGFGPVAPFDAAAIVLTLGALIIAFTWTENYGENGGRTALSEQMRKAAGQIASDPKIALLGAMQSLFEGAMYTFVFLWTPALQPHGEDIPFGLIFSIFMVACMAGSAVAGRLLAPNSGYKVERYMQTVFIVAALTMFVPVVFHMDSVTEDDSRAGQPIGWNGKLQLLAFCLFEAAVGVFWPSMMKMRSEYVPEECRATIINFFRIPLNLFVCIVLANVSKFPLAAMFGMCAVFLGVCAVCQMRLEKLASVAHRNLTAEEMPLKPSNA